jgi:hypothetical protein
MFHISKGSLTCRKILRRGTDGFTSPQKESVLRIFIALKNPSSSAGFEPAKIGSSDKHANHLTTDYLWLTKMVKIAVSTYGFCEG